MRYVLVQFGVLLGLATLAACGGGSPPPPPLLSLDGRSCATEPDLQHALPLTLVPVKPATVPLDFGSACWQSSDGRKSTYLAVQLPEASQDYLVTVESAPVGSGLLSPRLVVLDVSGKSLREIPRDSFQFHGLSLSAGIRAHQGERYLIVASDPGLIGRSESRITNSTEVPAPCVGSGCLHIYVGHEAANTLVYAYNGSITVTARPLPNN